MKSKKIILIDGNSLVYRAFYALPTTLATKSGQVTNAAYGFTSMLIKLLDLERPDAIAVAFDSKAPTFRHKAFEEYKAQRPKTPDELISQLPLVKEVLEALSIAMFEHEGYEADDILGTLARKAEELGYEVSIVTGDKDALQLVSPQVKIITTRKGITDIVVYDRPKVEEKYGLPPEKIVDMLGLKGDASDNIPGVPGVGEKTAVKLIREFGSLENVLQSIDKISGTKLKEILSSYGEQAKLSKELAVLRCDVPVEVDFEEIHFGDYDKEKVKSVFSSLEFNTLLQRLFPDEISTKSPPSGKKPSIKVKTISTSQELSALQRELNQARKVGLSLAWGEANLFGAGLKGLAIAISEAQAYYLSFEEGVGLDAIKEQLESAKLERVVHDGKSMLIHLKEKGVSIPAFSFDTMIASYLLDPAAKEYSLDQLVYNYLGASLAEEKDIAKKTGTEASLLLALKIALEDELEQKKLTKLFYEIEMPLVPILAQMEIAGVSVDENYLASFSSEVETSIHRLEQEVFAHAGEEFNINSPQQLSQVLFKKLKLKPIKKTKTGQSTDFSVLLKLVDKHPVIEKILAYRELAKLKSTYIDALPKLVDPKDGRIHTSFNQAMTATGRLSSSEPNLQNIPIRTELGKRVREAFVPARGGDLLLVADYSQIELRVLAHLSGDENLIEAFNEGKDIHASTASEVFGVAEEEVTSQMRRRAKAINFGIVYGMSARGLSKRLGITDEEAQAFIDKYFQRYPKVKEYIDKTINFAYKHGYVRTILGRIRYLPELKSSNYQMKSLGERLAINTPMQGSAADIIKIAMVNLDSQFKEENLPAEMVLQVHDELVFEVPPQAEEEVSKVVKKVMEEAYPLDVKLKVDIATGPNWKIAK